MREQFPENSNIAPEIIVSPLFREMKAAAAHGIWRVRHGTFGDGGSGRRGDADAWFRGDPGRVHGLAEELPAFEAADDRRLVRVPLIPVVLYLVLRPAMVPAYLVYRVVAATVARLPGGRR